jgi:hypothetical protein
VPAFATARLPAAVEGLLSSLAAGCCRQELASAVVGEGLRPTLPKQSPPGYAELLSACWHMDPSKRPAFQQVRASRMPAR